MLQTDIQEGFYRETGFVCCAFLLLCRRQWSWGETMEDGGHRKETVIAEILGTVGGMGTSTTQEAKHNRTLERMRGKSCALRDSYHSTGHCCEKTHSAAHTAQIQGLVSAASVPRAPPIYIANTLFCLQRSSHREEIAPFDPAWHLQRKTVQNWVFGRSLQRSQPRN